MLRRRGQVLMLVAVLLAARAVEAQTRETRELPWPVPERYLLDNGLEVILQVDARTPELAILLAYRVGRIDDPPGLEGLAHLVEHMTFRGSRHVPALQALSWLQHWGATESQAYTSEDYTVFYTVGPAEHLERVLWVESDRMAFALEAMTDPNLELERAIVARERTLRASMGGGVDDLIASVAYPRGHPRQRTLDVEAGFERIELGDAQWLFQRGYRPDNATLAIVGNFDVGASKALIAKYFGPIVNPRARLERAATPALAFGGQATLHVDARRRVDAVRFGWALPVDVLDQGRAQLTLLSAALEKLLDERLVRSEQIASGVKVQISSLGAGVLLWLEVAAAERIDAGRLSAAVTRALYALQRAPLSDATFRALRNGAEWDLLFELESPLARAHRLVFMRAPARPRELFDPPAILRALRAMTPEDLRRSATEWLPSAHRLDVHIRGFSTASRSRFRRLEGVLLPRRVLP